MWGKILIASCVLPWPSALAAPWIQDEGAWYGRVSIVSEEVERLQGHRQDVYVEYGLNETWTTTLKGESVTYQDANGFDSRGWRATARRQLYQSDQFRVSLEGGVLQGAAIGGRNGCDRLGIELRSGVAWSGALRKQQIFAFGEVAGRFHDGCERQRFEAGYGSQVSENVWTITQVWIERGAAEAESDKLQTEIAWLTDLAEFAIGYRREVGNTFQEEGVVFSIARRFR